MKITTIKKRQYILSVSIILLIFLITLISTRLLSIFKLKYQSSYDELKKNSDMLNYTMSYEDFFSEKFQYPKDKNDLKEYYLESIRHEKFLASLIDPFSKNGEEFMYIPLYSSANHLREGYLLISAGIDGEINNVVNDTVFFENVAELQFYNELPRATSLSYREFKFNYNLRDYLFGSKDLLIEYTNGIDIFVNNAISRVYTPSELTEELLKRSFTRFECSIKGIAKKVNDSIILVSDSSHEIICKMYAGREFNLIENDTVKIAGKYFSKYDTTTTNIQLSNCILLNQ